MKLFDQLAADGEAQAVTFDSRVLVARKAKERLENPLERFGGYAWPVVDHRHAPVVGSGLTLDPDMSARGSVLDRVGNEVPKDLLAERGVCDHLRFRLGGDSFPAQAFGQSGRTELAIDLPDDGAQRERPVRGGPGSVDEPGIIEISACETEQVIAERDHCQQMPALFHSHRGAGVSQQKIEACTQRDQGTAQFVAQTGEKGSQLTRVDGEVLAFGRERTTPLGFEMHFHGKFVCCLRRTREAGQSTVRWSTRVSDGRAVVDKFATLRLSHQTTTIWLARRGCPSVRSSTA